MKQLYAPHGTRRRELVPVALGEQAADVVIAGGRLVNVSTGEIYAADVAIKGDRIAAVGDVDYTCGPQTETIDASGRFLCPGLIEGHLHSYHTYLSLEAFSEGLVTHGVTAYADGFYGQGIVGGIEAVRASKDAFDQLPLRLLFLVPTLAYLQNRDLGLTAAPGVSVEDLFEMLEWPGCYGLEEPPSDTVLVEDPAFDELYERTLAKRMVLTGHGAGASERAIQAYAAMGCTTDHEMVESWESVSRARAGYKLLMRMASSVHNQPAALEALVEHRLDPRAFGFCADEVSPTKLVATGSTLTNVRDAIARGVPPVTAIQMATINTAEAFFAQQDLGLVAPGRFADILLIEDLAEFTIDRVIVGGGVVSEGGELAVELPRIQYPASCYDTIQLPAPLTAADLDTRTDLDAETVEVRVIGKDDAAFQSDERRARLAVRDGIVVPDVVGDVLPIAMVDRLGRGTGIGTGFVQGFGLERGAIASTVNAMCENLVAVGASTADMAFAMNHLAEIGGGFVVVEDGEILALLPLPLLGLMNDEPLAEAMPKLDDLMAAIRSLGCTMETPLMSLEFSFACGQIGDVKLSDEGLLDVAGPRFVDVVVG